MKNSTFEFESKKDWLTMSFLALWILLLTYAFLGGKGATLSTKLDFSDLKSSIICILVIYVTFLSLKQILWIIAGKLIVEFNNDKIIVNNKYSFIDYKKTYLIPKITDMEVKENVDSGTSWLFGGLRVADRDEKILFFNYNGKESKLGTKANNFSAEKIKSEIKLRTTLYKNNA